MYVFIRYLELYNQNLKYLFQIIFSRECAYLEYLIIYLFRWAVRINKWSVYDRQIALWICNLLKGGSLGTPLTASLS
jgi:hypothetical protein